MQKFLTWKNISITHIMLTSHQYAWACAVCGTATEESKKAFIISTAALSVVPLLMIGGVIYYLYWANRRKIQPDSTASQIQD
jgi:hypothetical protein